MFRSSLGLTVLVVLLRSNDLEDCSSVPQKNLYIIKRGVYPGRPTLTHLSSLGIYMEIALRAFSNISKVRAHSPMVVSAKRVWEPSVAMGK